MSTLSSTPVLLRRIAKLEVAVGRISEILSSLRSAVNLRGGPSPALARSTAPARRGRKGKEAAVPLIPATRHLPVAGGLVGAIARGEAARVQWIKDGLVVPGEQLAQAWGVTRQALAPACARGDLFAVKVGNRLYYASAFLTLDRESVATVCCALGGLSSSEKLTFWLREHGALAGKSVAAALDAGEPVTKVERLARAWADERGAARVVAPA